MSAKLPAPKPRQFVVDNQRFEEFHYNELSTSGQFGGVLRFHMNNDSFHLNALAGLMALNSRIEGKEFGSHLIMQRHPEYTTIVAMVSIYPAELTYACAQIERSYNFESAGVVMIDSKGAAGADQILFLRAGLAHAYQCMQRIVDAEGVSKTWCVLTNERILKEVMASDGWTSQGLILLVEGAGKRIRDVWSITVQPILELAEVCSFTDEAATG